MPGKRLYTFHEGDRSEYLFTFFLSSICAVTPVPRQEDYGLDFLCALTRKDGRSLFVEKEFAVQVKSVSEKYISYGGFDHTGKWKNWETKWLFEQSHPLFIASVDRDKWNVKLFATCRKWFVQWMSGHPFEIRFVLKELPETGDPYRFQNEMIEQNTEYVGDAKRWTIPLGKPIVEIELRQLDDPRFRVELYECIDRWIELERKNIQNYLLRVPVSFEFVDWETNKVPSGCMLTMRSGNNIRCYPFYNPTHGWNIEPSLSTMIAPALSLAMNAGSQGQREVLESVRPLLNFLVEHAYLDSAMLDYAINLLENYSKSN